MRPPPPARHFPPAAVGNRLDGLWMNELRLSYADPATQAGVSVETLPERTRIWLPEAGWAARARVVFAASLLLLVSAGCAAAAIATFAAPQGGSPAAVELLVATATGWVAVYTLVDLPPRRGRQVFEITPGSVAYGSLDHEGILTPAATWTRDRVTAIERDAATGALIVCFRDRPNRAFDIGRRTVAVNAVVEAIRGALDRSDPDPDRDG